MKLTDEQLAKVYEVAISGSPLDERCRRCGAQPGIRCTEGAAGSMLTASHTERNGPIRRALAVGELRGHIDALGAEVERLRRALPPHGDRAEGGVGEGSWAVFAEKVVAERDAYRAALTTISRWREECHSHDADMGHPPRDFDEDEIQSIEAHAKRALDRGGK